MKVQEYESMDQEFHGGLGVLFSKEVQDSINAVRRIAGYKLDVPLREPFLYFHRFITDPVPKYIKVWRSDPKEEHWYLQHAGGVLSNAQSAFGASHYHMTRLVQIESDVEAALSKIDFQSVIPTGSAVGVGGTNRMDYEYHAFVFAARRSLDYLTLGLAAYFRETFNSFRRLPKSIGQHRNEPVAVALLKVQARVAPRLGFLLSDGADKSIRDLIAHHRHVDVGTLNLTNKGLSFVGGGEKLNMPQPEGLRLQIRDAITARFDDVKDAITEVTHAFVDAARVVDQGEKT